MESNLFEEKIDSKEVFKGKILRVYFDKVRLPNNKIATREKVSHPGAVAVVPLNDRNEVILVKQYRYPINKVLIEIPAGKLDSNESPIVCAGRELEEEVGAGDGNLILLATIYTSPGFSDEKMNIYLAQGFKEKDNKLDDDEFLHIMKIKFNKCLEMINKGEISDAKSIIGILMTRNYMNKND
ncbi:MAG: NUDIX hydrolase [Actinobacteria bacterium]|nr:NUDIX hydrolase [Actinomycetota bacterium]